MKILKIIVLIAVIIIVLIICLVLYAHFVEPNSLVVNKLSIQSATKVEPFKIVFFSDTHFGKFYDQGKIEEVVEKINEQEGDIVIFGGDFFNAYHKDKSMLDLDYFQGQLNKIEAKYKKIAVWGNHDYGGGSERIYEEVISGGGFELLKNGNTNIDEINITITGLDDYLLGQPDTSLDTLVEDRFNLVITHAPDIADDINMDKVDFIVGGHSHGGQVSLPFITSKILPKGARKYIKGVYEFESARNAKLFVSKGVGMTNLPYRFNSVPEIAVIEVNGSK